MRQAWVAAVVVGVVAVAAADTPKAGDKPAEAAAMEQMAKYATPGDGHKKLEPLVGTFTYTGKVWMMPGQPPMEFTGKCERKWVLGGRFLQETFENEPAGTFSGVGTMGYNNATNEYTAYWMDSMSTGAMFSTGKATAKGFTFVGDHHCPMEGCKVKSRDVLEFGENGKHTITAYKTGKDGKEAVGMELKFTKAK